LPVTNVRSAYKSMHQIVAEKLTDSITTGVFPPGHKFNEPELAADFGVSRGPVREALRTLEGQGLVQLIPGKGAAVTTLSRAEVGEIYYIRIELEGLAARIGTEQIGEGRLKRMARLLFKMDAAETDNLQYLKLNNQFHLTLYEASNMPRLCEMITDLMTKTLPYYGLYISPRALRDKTHAEHPLLYDAVVARDCVAAEKITKAHLSPGASEIVRLIPE
jgi:DNA-binding GntR family transcriptional regulator